MEAWDQALAHAQMLSTQPVLTMPYAEPMTETVGERAIDPEHREEMTLWARRYVVERCIYGVDINPLAVEMAKLSLWLTTLAKERSFTFLDHALRCGDSLVGVDMEQLLTWSLDRKGRGEEVFQQIVRRAVEEATQSRTELRTLPVVDAGDAARKHELLVKAERAVHRVRLASDLVIAPSFFEANTRVQAEARDRLQAAYCAQNDTQRRWDELRGRSQSNAGIATALSLARRVSRGSDGRQWGIRRSRGQPTLPGRLANFDRNWTAIRTASESRLA